MPPAPICVYLVGEPPPEVAADHGDSFFSWFERLVEPHPARAVARDGLGGAPPDPREFAAVVITGSPASLTAPEPWMEASVELVREAHRIGTPVLGVCFGHQVIGAAFGGEVRRNPQGWEMGTFAVELAGGGARDPLLAGLPERFEVNLSHQDVVAPGTLPPPVRVLAGNRRAPVQVIAAGDATRGVQFHPEFDGAIVRSYLHCRYPELEADAEARAAPHDHPERLLERARDCPHGEQVFANFVREFALRA
jgi:GMP synthase (glutamine-hydrolysing)